jgi:K+ transporter
MRLNFWPKVKNKVPNRIKGQPYIPSINWLNFDGSVLLHFEESETWNMPMV